MRGILGIGSLSQQSGTLNSVNEKWRDVQVQAGGALALHFRPKPLLIPDISSCGD